MSSGAGFLGQQLFATAAGTSWALLALSFVPAGLVALAVANKSKTVAALAQLSGLQEREAQRELLAKNALELDKLWFCLSVSNLALTAFIIGASPRSYFVFFTPKTVSLIALRWYSFQKRGQHFLLWDFCYWANAVCIYYCWVAPRNHALFQVVFMCANGPLAWSVLAFNHAMIFHSFPHVTSAVVHLSPMILSYGLRWHVGEDDERFTVCAGGRATACDAVGFGELFSNAMLRFYLWWNALYYVWILFALGKYIERKGYQTLWDRFLTMKTFGPPLQRLMRARGKLVAQFGYMLIHLGLASSTFAIAVLLWHSQIAHFAFVVTMVMSTVRNGADFYFQCFSDHYKQLLDGATTASSIDKQILKASAGIKAADPKGC